MNEQQLKAVQELQNVFPKLQVGICDSGLLVILTNSQSDESILFEQFGEVAEVDVL